MRLLPLIALIALMGCNPPLTNPFKGGIFHRPAAVKTAAHVPTAGVPAGVNGIGVGQVQTQTLAPLGSGAAKPQPAKPQPGKPQPAKLVPNTPAPAQTTPAVQPILPPASPEEAACRNSGGRWGSAGKSGALSCFHASKDGGKACHKQGDCSSQCLARSKTCAPFWPIFGCTEVLQKDGSLGKLCID